jgi:hypothetical protein
MFGMFDQNNISNPRATLKRFDWYTNVLLIRIIITGQIAFPMAHYKYFESIFVREFICLLRIITITKRSEYKAKIKRSYRLKYTIMEHNNTHPRGFILLYGYPWCVIDFVAVYIFLQFSALCFGGFQSTLVRVHLINVYRALTIHSFFYRFWLLHNSISNDTVVVPWISK